MSKETTPIVTDEQINPPLSYGPAKIATGKWAIHTSHLIGYDHTCDTEADAKSITVLIKKLITKDRELIQMAVDAIIDNAKHRLLTEGEEGDTVNDFLNMTLNTFLTAASEHGITPTDR